ncbi:MAG: hypothetical protein AABX65_01290 [Nanoarchaeota archaeon]
MADNLSSGVRKYHVIYLALAIASILFIFNVYLLQQKIISADNENKIAGEKQKPAQISITRIEVKSCVDCFSLDNAISGLKEQNVNITAEKKVYSDSADGADLIKKYEIEKLPALIIEGELNRSEQLVSYFEEVGEIKDNKLLYTAVMAPYYSEKEKKIVGKVEVFYLKDSGCAKCTDISGVIENLNEAGVVFSGVKNMEYSSAEGQMLVSKYGIKHIPALIISGDIKYYSEIKSGLEQAGASFKEGAYALHSTIPPYRNLSNNRIEGLASLIILNDSSCNECYDQELNAQVVERLGVVLKSKEVYDTGSAKGKELINKYKITKVPIIILSPEAKVYENFVSAWTNVGEVESDGWFVMTKPDLLGTYKDLSDNKIKQSEK